MWLVVLFCGAVLAAPEGSLPANDNSITAPAVKENIPAVKENIPPVKDDIPAVKEIIPIGNDNFPAVKDTIPAVKEIIPAVNDNLPAIKDTIPAVKEDFPAIKDTIPAVKEDFPAIKDTIPAVKEIIQAINDNFPAVKENIPVVKNDNYVPVRDVVSQSADVKYDSLNQVRDVPKGSVPAVSASVGDQSRAEFNGSVSVLPVKPGELVTNKKYAEIIGQFITELLQIPILLLHAFSDAIAGVTGSKPSLLLVQANAAASTHA